MNEHSSDQDEKQTNKGDFPSEEIGTKGREDKGESDPTEYDPYEEVKRQVKRLLLYIQREWSDLKFFKRAELVATYVGLFALILYTAYTVGMYGANRDAANAAESAANTAEKTLKQSIQAYQVDQRAWVSVLDIEPKNQGSFGIKIVLTNTGKTPARGFTLSAAGDVGGKRGSEQKLSGSGIIAPGGKFSSFMQANGSITNSTKLAVHGRVDYSSVFGGQHWTTFCYYLIPEKVGTPSGFAPCESGNNTDDNSAQ
jgi:Tfp pilus assembly protein PilE